MITNETKEETPTMRKTILGLVVTAAIATPLALATSAQAANNLSSDSGCTPVTEIFAAPAKTHIEYKWTPVKSNAGPTQWTDVDAPANTPETFIVKGANVNYFRDGVKTQTVIDTPAVQAVDGTTCVIPLPANPLTGLNGISQNMTVPTPEGTAKYTFSPVVNHVALNGKIGTTVTTNPGYVFANGVTSKVFAATPDNSGYVFLSDPSRHINLPDVFDISIMEGLWSTKVAVTIVNDTAAAGNFQYELVQEDGLVWVTNDTFTDGQPGNVIEAGASRAFTFDAMYNVYPSGADVPDDLTFDFKLA